MFKKKYKPYFESKTCDICRNPATMFRCIDNKTYLLCDSRKCSFVIKIRHGWHEPIIGK